MRYGASGVVQFLKHVFVCQRIVSDGFAQVAVERFYYGLCSPVVLCIILAREFAVSGLRMVAAGAKDGKVIAANMWGKVKTVLQMLTIIFYYFTVSLTGNVLGQQCADIASVLCWVVAAVTAISGIKYLWDNRSFINTAK